MNDVLDQNNFRPTYKFFEDTEPATLNDHWLTLDSKGMACVQPCKGKKVVGMMHKLDAKFI